MDGRWFFNIFQNDGGRVFIAGFLNVAILSIVWRFEPVKKYKHRVKIYNVQLLLIDEIYNKWFIYIEDSVLFQGSILNEYALMTKFCKSEKGTMSTNKY